MSKKERRAREERVRNRRSTIAVCLMFICGYAVGYSHGAEDAAPKRGGSNAE